MDNLTNEQREIVEGIKERDGMFAVNAIAGSGKTRTSIAIVDAVRPKDGFYTAYNRGIVEDTGKRMNGKVPCKTMHALAWHYLRPSGRLCDLTYADIDEPIAYDEKQMVINAIDDYHRSASTNPEEYLDAYYTDSFSIYKSNLRGLCLKYIEHMEKGIVHPTFNYMLKWLQKAIIDDRLPIEKDLFILDEAQDSSGVVLDIFKRIKCPKKVFLGDRHQNIYSSFMATVNAFETLKLKPDYLYSLTRSFRCNENVAEVVERYGQQCLDGNFTYRSGVELSDEVETEAVITRTNAALIEEMRGNIWHGRRFTLIRPVKEIFELPMAILNAMGKGPMFSKNYGFLRREYQICGNGGKATKLQWFLRLESRFSRNQNIQASVGLLRKLDESGINIFELKKMVDGMKPDPARILATAHSFKGLEADRVYISPELNVKVGKAIDTASRMLEGERKEEKCVYYVALSRARKELLNSMWR